ncbi:MAG: UDP-N-acetylglucosamine 2-epimerase (non-hydrolyzing) [Stygiobacter sp.]|nr:MAG: UDP-N-acetylglucosamine 2-epimerase (non-hydrolyzing) [Stygiobacter sp.]
MKILSIVGARPQFIKLSAFSRAIKNYDNIEEIILHTGQHYDDNMSDIFFSELQIPKPNYNLNIGSGSHGFQTGEMIKKIEEVLFNEKPDYVIVYGDTNSTIAGAIAAVKMHIPIAHIEAGLRSFNKNMPEEVNRIVTDSIADLLFAPTETAVFNLQHEGRKSNTFLSGDIMLDSTLFYQNKLGNNESQKENSTFYLLTLHRSENTDSIIRLTNIFNAMEGISKRVVFPIHPRTKEKIKELINIPGNIEIIEPLGYLDLLRFIIASEKVLTDSGGIQKEAYFLKKQCITLRDETEWVETLRGNWNILAGSDIEKITQAVIPNPIGDTDLSKFGNGNATKFIIEKILSLAK